VIVVDVRDDEQVDTALASAVNWQLRQAGLQRWIGLVRPGVDQHAPGTAAGRARDQQAVAEAGGQDIQGDGGFSAADYFYSLATE
jgi:hypothetical protein